MAKKNRMEYFLLKKVDRMLEQLSHINGRAERTEAIMEVRTAINAMMIEGDCDTEILEQTLSRILFEERSRIQENTLPSRFGTTMPTGIPEPMRTISNTVSITPQTWYSDTLTSSTPYYDNTITTEQGVRYVRSRTSTQRG